MAESAPVRSSGQASLFGKLPCAADFLRIQHSHRAGVLFDSWLQASLQQLGGTAWPAHSVRYLYVAPSSDALVAGVVAPSRDRAGRKFPVTIYAVHPIAPLSGRVAAAPIALESFFAVAEALLARAATLEREALVGAVAELRAPAPAGGAIAEQALARALTSRSAAQFAHALFTEDAESSAQSCFEALSRLSSETVREPSPTTRVIDCPIVTHDDVSVWLWLTQRCLGSSPALPSVFWYAEPAGARMLLSLGSPPSALPLWLAQPKRASERLVRLVGGPDRAATAPSLLAIDAERWGRPLDRFLSELVVPTRHRQHAI